MHRKGYVRTRPLADLIGPVLGPAMAAQGFSGHDIVASWPEIVGERLASVSRPVRVEWPRRRGRGDDSGPEPATLVVRVEGVFALEMQHLAPLVLERINAVYGWRCVGRLVLKQGPIARDRAPVRPPASLSETERQRIREAADSLAEEPLRRAVERLGCAIASRPDEPSSGPGASLPDSSAGLS